ncbi:MAG: molybdopterin-dependent oxidoreductase [Sphingopyxis sp.]|nr:molybdopterin-dependent oxidoreductase [Sphingopyxis sp.]
MAVHARTCHICEANCGVLVELDGRHVVSIKGNRDHVLSRGHICPKATAIGDLQDDPDRLRQPMKRTADGWQAISWDAAFSEIAARVVALQASQARPAFYAGNPNAHDYAIAGQMGALRKAVGSKGTFSASTLDQIPHHYVQYQMYGHVSLAAVPDIDHAHAIVIIGGNPAASNGSIWTVPDFKRRVSEMQARGGKLVVVDPRRTETAKLADQWLPVIPGTDTALLIAILRAVRQRCPELTAPLAALVDDSWAALDGQLAAFDDAALANHCGVAVDAIASIANLLTSGQPAAVYGRMGVSVTEFGTLNQWLIQLINLVSGNLDRVGGTMFPEPLLDTIALVGKGSIRTVETARGPMPSVMGEIPMIAFADELLRDDDQRVRMLFVMAGNPVLSAPDGARTDEALAGLDLMVSFDMYVTETSRHAHYILPPCGPLEKDHYPLFFGPLAIRNYGAYSPALLDKEPGSKADWEVVAELAAAIFAAKGEAMPNTPSPREQLDQMLRASPRGMSLAKVEAQPNGVDLGPLRPNLAERIRTSNKRIHAVPAPLVEELERFKAELTATPGDILRLIGRRHVRSNNSWLHNSKRLVKGPDRCTLMIHPDDAAARGIADGDLVEVASRVGRVTVAAEGTDDMMPGGVSLPHGWGHGRAGVGWQTAASHPGVSINDLTDPERYCRLTGNAVLNATPVTVERAAVEVAAE